MSIENKRKVTSQDSSPNKKACLKPEEKIETIDLTNIDKPIVYLLLDVSGSMQSRGKLEAAQKALIPLLELMKDQKHENNIVSLLTFNDNHEKVYDAVVAKNIQMEMARKKIFDIVAHGCTAIWDTVEWCLQNHESEKERKIIIHCITDGEDTCSKIDREKLDKLAAKFDQLTFDIVYIGSENDEAALTYQSAQESGLATFSCSQPAQLSQVSLNSLSQAL